MTEPEAPTLSGRTRAPRGTTRIRKPDRRARRGRRRNVRQMYRTGLPRVLARQNGLDGIEATRYLSGLVERFRIPLRPLAAWAEDTLIDAAKAHLVLVHLRRALDEEMARPESHPAEQRRLRSEIRRQTSQRRQGERILGSLVAEQRAHDRARPVTTADLLARVGSRR